MNENLGKCGSIHGIVEDVLIIVDASLLHTQSLRNSPMSFIWTTLVATIDAGPDPPQLIIESLPLASFCTAQLDVPSISRTAAFDSVC